MTHLGQECLYVFTQTCSIHGLWSTKDAKIFVICVTSSAILQPFFFCTIAVVIWLNFLNFSEAELCYIT
jgi:hypothetical protein